MSFTEKVVFLHIPKTAGMSFARILKQIFKPDEIFPGIDPVQLLDQFEENLKKYQLFSGHFYYEVLENFAEKPVTLTFLRNPVERLRSHYYFYQKQPQEAIDKMRDYDRKIVELSRELTFEDFINHENAYIESGFYNLQTRYIASNTGYALPKTPEEESELLALAKKNLHTIDFVGIVEEFDLAVELFKKMFSIGAELRNQKININAERPRSGFDTTLFQDKSRAQRRVALDLALYEEAKRIFTDLLARYELR